LQHIAHHGDRPTVALFLGMAIDMIFLGLVVTRTMLVDRDDFKIPEVMIEDFATPEKMN